MNTIRKLGNRRFFLFTVILYFKCTLAWHVVFGYGPHWASMVTEIPFYWCVFCLIERFASKRTLLYYTIANLGFTILYFTVLMYFKYYGVIVTYRALSTADKVTHVGQSTYSLMDPYYLLMFADTFLLIGIYLFMKKYGSKRPLHFQTYGKRFVVPVFYVSALICLFNIWPNRASMNENRKAEDMGLLNYQVYTVLSDSREEELIEIEDISQFVIQETKGTVPPANPLYFGAAKGKHVMMVQLESFQEFLIGLRVNGQEVTPNLNRLAQESFYFDRFYSMVGQGTTSDAEYVVNTSLYVPGSLPAAQIHSNKRLPGLPKLLGEAGYTTVTFHTNDVQFWNRKELYRALGFNRFYDKSFFGEEDLIAFGASDEVLYRKTFEELLNLEKTGSPFYAHVISMSAHHPYGIPKSKVRLELPEEWKDTLVGNYLEAQHYSDYAVGELIRNLKKSGLWEKSLVVLYGDHQGLPIYALETEEKEWMREMVGHEYGYADVFKVPLILHAPGITYPSVIGRTGGQIDILPTIANLTGQSLSGQIHFGTDLLNAGGSYNLLPMRHFLPSGSLLTDSSLFIPGKAYEDGTNYSLNAEGSKGETVTREQFERALKLLSLSDSYTKQLDERETDESTAH